MPRTIKDLRNHIYQRGYHYTTMRGKGIHLDTPDDITISIQWGTGNYCSNRLLSGRPFQYRLLEGTNVEISMWYAETNESYIPEGWDNEVKGWVSIPDALAIVDYMMTGVVRCSAQ